MVRVLIVPYFLFFFSITKVLSSRGFKKDKGEKEEDKHNIHSEKKKTDNDIPVMLFFFVWRYCRQKERMQSLSITISRLKRHACV